MSSIMIALLVLFGLCLAVGAWIFIRQRIIFRMGLRNVPRRRSQTILIVIGLMLSTLIISAALTTGDTLDGSIKSTVTDVSQNTHELVVKSTTNNPYASSNGAGPQPGVTFPQTVYTNLKQKLAGNNQIATITPMLSESVPAVDPRTRLSEPDLVMMGIDSATIGPVGQIKSTSGQVIDLNNLPADSIVLGKTPADKMNAKVGDTLTVYVNNAPHQLKVADIVTDWIGTGSLTAGTNGGFAMPLDRAQALFNKPGEISFIAIANAGGVGASDAVQNTVNNALQGTPYTTVTVLKDGIHFAELAGNIFTTLFVVLGLFSIAAGILLIFLIFVLLAAERQSEMGMARAVGLRRRQLTQMFLAEGITYDLLSALVGAALGVGVALVIAQAMGGLVGSFFHIKPTFTWRSLVVAYTLGVVVTFLTILVSSWRVSRLNIVQAIRDIPDPVHQKASRRWLIFGILAVIVGAVMLMSGASSHSAFLFMTGVTLVPLGLAMILRRVGLSARLLYSIASIIVLAFWLMPSSIQDKFLPKLNGGMEMFFLSGIMMVAAATVLIIWNAEVITWVVGLFGRAFSRWLPAVKTAIAYPMASKGRTGMTIAMFSLIIFSLVMMATMNANITAVFTGDKAAAGWSIQAMQSPTNPIDNFQQALAKNDVNTKPITAVGKLDMIDATNVAIRVAGTQGWKNYAVNGADASFINNSDLPLSTLATGYANDKAALEAVRDNPDLAIIDSNAIAGNGGFGSGNGFQLTGIKATDKTMAPFKIQIREADGTIQNLTIIGVLDSKVSMFPGLMTSEQTFSSIFSKPTKIGYYLKTASGTDNTAYAKDVKAGLISYGVQADSFKDLISKGNALATGFLKLIEGFMALGLVVGIAALGVISFRSVVERRQQIGMLRAIGYKRSMVEASFLIESTMITFLGVAAGTIMAVILGYNLMSNSDFNGGTGGTTAFIIPWVSIVVFVGIALIAGLVMSYIPARMASNVPIADALRYE